MGLSGFLSQEAVQGQSTKTSPQGIEEITSLHGF
jgi:hypothetical protein